MDHCIEETVLLTKRCAKQKYRRAIFDAWNHSCAYCGAPANTLDHVKPRSKGGQTQTENLVAACRDCNRRKSSAYWVTWFRMQPFWDPEREADVWLWIHQYA